MGTLPIFRTCSSLKVEVKIEVEVQEKVEEEIQK